MSLEGREDAVTGAADNSDDGVQLPPYHQLYDGLLQLLATGSVWRTPDLVVALADRFGLDSAALDLTFAASGAPVLENRMLWAATDLTKAELVERVGPNEFRITPDGLNVVNSHVDREFLLSRPTFARWVADQGGSTPDLHPSDSDEPTVWLVRAGKDGVLAPAFVERGAVIIGWGKTGDVGGCSREEIAARVAATFAGESTRLRGQAANALDHLVSTMRDGDLILTPEPQTRTLVLGTVSGSYRFFTDPPAPGYQHAREVRWFARVSRDELSYGARNSIGTLLTLSRPGHVAELRGIAQAHASDAPPAPLDQTRRGRAEPSPPAPVAIPPNVSVPTVSSSAEFDTVPKDLMFMLEQLHAGDLALPDFQRSFVWPPEATRELLVSIIRRFPAGNLLLLQGSGGQFKARRIEGSPNNAPVRPAFLILDGQQRLTSLYQAVFGVGQSRFFLDIGALVRGTDVDEAVRSMPLDRASAFNTIEAQATALMMPLSVVRNGGVYPWVDHVIEARDDEDPGYVRQLLHRIHQAYIEPIVRYRFPVTMLPESTALEAVCTIFETLNRTGRPLTPFELISARAFAGGLSLHDLWIEACARFPILADFEIEPYYLLQLIALRLGPSCKRSTVLGLAPSDIEGEWEAAIADMAAAITVLRDQCGVLIARWLPYRPMLIPLALAWRDVMSAEGPARGARRAKLVRWFWCACFTGEYESSSASLAERDGPALRAWLTGGEEPPVVKTFEWNPQEWRKVTARQHGAYRATIALTLCAQPRDFHTAAPLTVDLIATGKIDDHHVFPKAFLTETGRGGEPDSVLNHTLIDRTTNNIIGKRAPSRYLAEIRQALGDALDAVLSSHCLPTGPSSPLEDDDYDAFLDWRIDRLDEHLTARTGERGVPLPSPADHLGRLNSHIEAIELDLRSLILDRFPIGEVAIQPHILQKVADRMAGATKKQPSLRSQPADALDAQIVYFDLRELEAVICGKAWQHFADVFGTKEQLTMRFGQLAELRNTIRHSRPMTTVVLKDGEAAIRWFVDSIRASSRA